MASLRLYEPDASYRTHLSLQPILLTCPVVAIRKQHKKQKRTKGFLAVFRVPGFPGARAPHFAERMVTMMMMKACMHHQLVYGEQKAP